MKFILAEKSVYKFLKKNVSFHRTSCFVFITECDPSSEPSESVITKGNHNFTITVKGDNSTVHIDSGASDGFGSESGSFINQGLQSELT